MYRYVIYGCTVLRNPVGCFNINCFLDFLCFISFRWWKLENQCSSHRLFVSWVSWILSLLQTVIHFPTTGIKWCMPVCSFSMLCFCRIVFVDFFLTNLILWVEGSSAAVPFGTLVAILALWFGISVPLTFVGAYFGFKKPVSMPSSTDQFLKRFSAKYIFNSWHSDRCWFHTCGYWEMTFNNQLPDFDTLSHSYFCISEYLFESAVIAFPICVSFSFGTLSCTISWMWVCFCFPVLTGHRATSANKPDPTPNSSAVLLHQTHAGHHHGRHPALRLHLHPTLLHPQQHLVWFEIISCWNELIWGLMFWS